jgi:hypothetical protein
MKFENKFRPPFCFLGGLLQHHDPLVLSSHLQKIIASEPSKSGSGQVRLLSVGTGFGG